MLILRVSGNAWMLRIVEDCQLLTKVFEVTCKSITTCGC